MHRNIHEQNILDNAPEWATHYMVSRGFAYDAQYAIEIEGTYYDNTSVSDELSYGYPFMKIDWTSISLKTLRDKLPVPTIIDAINHYRGDISCDHVAYVGGETGWVVCDHGEWLQESVCTREEFNEEVEELMLSGGAVDLGLYLNSNKKPLKKTVLYEYEKVKYNHMWEVLKMFEDGEALYIKGKAVRSHEELLKNLDQVEWKKTKKLKDITVGVYLNMESNSVQGPYLARPDTPCDDGNWQYFEIDGVEVYE